MQLDDKKKHCGVEEIFLRYGSMLYRIAVVMLGSTHDAEDVVQDTLIRYMEHKKDFQDQDHEKAWLIRVTVNLCKNRLLFARRHPQVEFSELMKSCEDSKAAPAVPHRVSAVLRHGIQYPGVCRNPACDGRGHEEAAGAGAQKI